MDLKPTGMRVLVVGSTRLGRSEEIADLVAFLTSPRAGYVTGANFRIDGGSTTQRH